VAYQPRIPEKFENLAGAQTYTFPVGEYEWQSSQSLRIPSVSLAGADYAYDLLLTRPGLRTVSRERITLTIQATTPTLVDTAIDNMRAGLWLPGRGKLFTIDNAGVRRWAYARPESMPATSWRAGDIFRLRVDLTFARFEDWFKSSAESATTTAASTPKNFTVNNPGNAPVYVMTIRLRANGATGFTNPALVNNTNGYSWSSTRDAASANSELKVDTGRNTIKYSNDNGSSYANDLALFTRGATQVAYFRLDPGDNELTYTDGATPDVDIQFDFYAAYF